MISFFNFFSLFLQFLLWRGSDVCRLGTTSVPPRLWSVLSKGFRVGRLLPSSKGLQSPDGGASEASGLLQVRAVRQTPTGHQQHDVTWTTKIWRHHNWEFQPLLVFCCCCCEVKLFCVVAYLFEEFSCAYFALKDWSYWLH